MVKAITRPNSEPAKSIADLLGPPPVLLGEDADRFAGILNRITVSVKPTDAIEQIWVRDVADLTWEVLRLRRLKVGLLLACAHAGLYRVLRPLIGDEAEKLASAWAKREPQAMQKVESLLKQCELGVDAITAETLTVKLDQIERFEAMIAAAEARLAAALREVDRHRAALGEALRAAANDIEDAEFEEVAAQNRLPRAAQ
jgi:hypothetical protein